MTKKKYEVHDFCDAAFQLLCGQIESDYTTILRRDILPKLDVSALMRLREIRTLMTVEYYDDPVSSTEIADYLRFDRGTVSRATKILKREGYVTSFSNPDDKRSPLIHITEAGRALTDQYRRLIKDHFAKLSEEVGDVFTTKESEDALRVLMALRNRAKEFVEIRENS